MARRKGRPRGLAPARKEGPDRKSLVKYVDQKKRTTLGYKYELWLNATILSIMIQS